MKTEEERYVEWLENMVILLSGFYQETFDMLLKKAKNKETDAFFSMPTIQETSMRMAVEKISRNTKNIGAITTEELNIVVERLICKSESGAPQEQLKADILDEFEHYRKLKADGRLIELPCKVGNKLWYYHDDLDDQPYVRQDKYGIAGIAIKRDGFYAICSDGCMDKIGTQYAMLTKEEAKKAWETQHDHK